MHFNKSILLFADKTSELSFIEDYCKEHYIKFLQLDKLSELLMSVQENRFDVLIIDDKIFPIKTDLLTIFSRRGFYVSNIIVYTNKKIDYNCVLCKNPTDLTNKLRDILDSINGVRPFIVNLDIYSKITEILNYLGINNKYKGCKYLIEILNRMILSDLNCISFKKTIYPFVASLYSVSEDSVERDVRNVLLKAITNYKFKEQLEFDDKIYRNTTRNIINSLLIYVKNNLNNAI